MHLGIDVSHHNTIDWSLIHMPAGVDGQMWPVQFCFVKVSEGVVWQDPKRVDNAAGAKGEGLKIGYYHFADMTSRGSSEAKNFMRSFANLPPPDFPLVLDIERKSGHVTPDDCLAWIEDFMSVPIYPMMIYGGKYFLDTALPPTHDLGKYPLWIPNYSLNVPAPHLPVGWTDYVAWQFSETFSHPASPTGLVDASWMRDEFFNGH